MIIEVDFYLKAKPKKVEMIENLKKNNIKKSSLIDILHIVILEVVVRSRFL